LASDLGAGGVASIRRTVASKAGSSFSGEGFSIVDDNTMPKSKDLLIHRSSLREAKWLNDLYTIYRDLDQTKEYLRMLIRENSHPSRRPAFFTAALIGAGAASRLACAKLFLTAKLQTRHIMRDGCTRSYWIRPKD
jgi:hypothetical protein